LNPRVRSCIVNCSCSLPMLADHEGGSWLNTQASNKRWYIKRRRELPACSTNSSYQLHGNASSRLLRSGTFGYRQTHAESDLSSTPVLPGPLVEKHMCLEANVRESGRNSIFTAMDSGNVKSHNIPPIRPTSPSPSSQDIARQTITKQQNSNYRSTSLKKMVSHSVNKTALHPSGVQ
jgi:hypothetical protein